MTPTTSWYASLIKPDFAPPAWIFGPAWTILYILIAISFGYVFYMFLKKKISGKIVLPFALNIIFNLAFSPIQFVMQNNFLAAIDIALVLGTIVWLMIAIWPIKKWVVYMNIPYLAWVSFATVLQFTVTYLNW